MRTLYRDPDGSWRPVRPLPTARRLKAEVWLARHRLRWLALLSIRAAERGLGRRHRR